MKLTSFIMLVTMLLPFASWQTGRAGNSSRQAGCDFRTILRAVRNASGGDRLNGVGELAAIGSARIAGLKGTAVFQDDLRDGRNATHFDIAMMGKSAEVYDGMTTWSQDISGGVHPLDSNFARELAITDAYLARRGYLRTSGTVAVACVGTRTEHGREMQLIRVAPRGGRPAELAIDSATHLLVSVTVKLPTTTRVTSYSDYRKDDGLVLPFSIAEGTVFEPANGFLVRVRGYRMSASVRPDDFVKPTPTDVAFMRNGVTSTTVPITLEAQQLLVWASIDGHAAMPFILDTGGHEILTTRSARALRLRSYGAGVSGGSGSGTIGLAYTRVRCMRIGDAELRDQPFLVIDYPYSFYERGKKTPLAGILGLEVFERFAARIDYGGGHLTLTSLSGFHYAGTGTHTALQFGEDMPLAEAAVDGRAGAFGIDTGNGGALVLYGHYLIRTGLGARYPNGISTRGSGTGGTNTGYIAKIQTFTIADRALHGVRSYFTDMKSGTFSSVTDAGDVGFDVLSRFIPTFDYATQALYLDSTQHAPSMLVNRGGVSVTKNAPEAFIVEIVRPNSSVAKVGITPGDTITAVDGTSASNISRADFETKLSAAAGTKMILRVGHRGKTRNVNIVLSGSH